MEIQMEARLTKQIPAWQFTHCSDVSKSKKYFYGRGEKPDPIDLKIQFINPVMQQNWREKKTEQLFSSWVSTEIKNLVFSAMQPFLKDIEW